jgi:RNA polymerase sigma-70 factor (ECF subfamily)
MKIHCRSAMNRASDLREAFDAFKARPGRDLLLCVLEHSQNTVYNLCYQVLRHAQEAEDAAQQVFLEVLDHLGEIPDAARFHAWVRQVSLRVALNRRRSQRRRWIHEQRAALMHSEGEESPPEDGSSIHEHLLRLDGAERSLLVAYFYEGKKLEALATDQGCSTTGMWKRLEKAKEALRRSLEKRTARSK